MGLLAPASRVTVSRNYSDQPTTTWGTSLTGSATPHALPASPTEVIASTSYDSDWIVFQLHGTHVSTQQNDALCNVYIGAGGSETLLIDSLGAGLSGVIGGGYAPLFYFFPLRISRGSRISASLRARQISDVAGIMITLGINGDQEWHGIGVETLGEDTTESRGTGVTVGSGSEGSWTSIGTTGRRWRYLLLCHTGGTDASMQNGTIAWDISADNSTVYQNMQELQSTLSTAELATKPFPVGAWCDIPSGTSLYVRGQADSAGMETQHVILYGVY